MVYPSRLKRNLNVRELEDIESIIQQKDFLKDFTHYIKRKQGSFSELE